MDFWRLGFQDAQRPINTLLEKKNDLTLAALLNDQEILQESLSGNELLFDFYCKPGIVRQLFDYIIEPHADELLGIKYPYLCTEIICLDSGPTMPSNLLPIHRFYEAILSQLSTILPKFWSFLNQDPSLPLNILGYFAKVNITLLNRYPDEMIRLIKQHPNIVSQLRCHLYSNLIQEIVYRIWSLESPSRSIVSWWNHQGWTQFLIDKLDPSLEPEEHTLSSQILVNMIVLCNEGRVHGNALLTDMVQDISISKYWKFLAQKDSKEYASSMTCILDVCMDLIRRAMISKELEPESPFLIDPFLVSFADHFSLLNDILTDSKHQTQSMKLSTGTLIPLGMERLKICEFLAELVQVDNFPQIISSLYQYDIVSKLFALFFQYEWNNFLHAAIVDFVANLFLRVLQKPLDRLHIIDSDTDIESLVPCYESLVYSLFSQARLVDRILQAYHMNDSCIEQSRGSKLGYMGHVYLITDEIIKLCNGWKQRNNDQNDNNITIDFVHDEFIQPFLTTYLRNPDWIEYIRVFHMIASRQQGILGGGPRPEPSAPESPDEEEQEGIGLDMMGDGSSLVLGQSLRTSMMQKSRSTSLLSDSSRKDDHRFDDDYSDSDSDSDEEDTKRYPLKHTTSRSLTNLNTRHKSPYDDEDDDDEEDIELYRKKMQKARTRKKEQDDEKGFIANDSPELLHESDRLARYFCQQVANHLPTAFASDEEEVVLEDVMDGDIQPMSGTLYLSMSRMNLGSPPFSPTGKDKSSQVSPSEHHGRHRRQGSKGNAESFAEMMRSPDRSSSNTRSQASSSEDIIIVFESQGSENNIPLTIASTDDDDDTDEDDEFKPSYLDDEDDEDRELVFQER